ncbi:tetratricopeptide repeat protein [Phenylobacterium sp. LjRoot219]|uniref:tetratricopeptide repeat protein n=1 Tax=Phenylobacterium sp. LjRoot219 TaxID=3342283 RepID=UPI003ECE5494
MSNVLQRGIEAHQRGDLAAATSLYQQTIGVAKHNLAVLHEQRGDYDQAISFYREALDAAPGRDESAASLSLTLLREGRYAEAWPLHERRRRLKRLNLTVLNSDWPEWTGEDLAGKRLAVLGEQGFGDQIMFARFIQPLQARGAEVRLICSRELARLLEGHTRLSRDDFDFWTYAMTVPLRLGVTLETLPPPAPLPIQWRGGAGVGVMASGNPNFAKHAQRTPPEAVQAELLTLGRDLRPEATGARDFLDTAEIIAGLDLVITIDTAVAHLAASLGAPTWILLPAVDSDWRWLRDREDSPWYPSARLFRQPCPGDWAGATSQMKAALAARSPIPRLYA